MARQKIVAGNWKMNKDLFEGKELVEEILKGKIAMKENQRVVIAPPFLQLPIAATQLKDADGYYLAAQNCHQQESGAYTGEISAGMLHGSGVDYVILGHSERRAYCHETSDILAKKVDIALENDLKVIFCVGEPLEVREKGTQNEYIAQQLKEGLFHLSQGVFDSISIAYEPIWAIGTGKTATKEQAQEMHHFIRDYIENQYGELTAEELTILYGGSCNPYNAADLFSQSDVDGGLIGGASLNARDFLAIIKALQENN